MGPEVNNIPKKELDDWSKYVGSYYQNNALGTSDDPKKEVAIRMQACIGAGVQY